MKFNNITCSNWFRFNISFAILIAAVVYTFAYSGITGLLICSAVALIAASVIDQFEIVVAVSVVFVMIYTLFFKKFVKRFEPFNPIVDRVNTMQNQYIQTKRSERSEPFEPMGTYSSYVEGFEDVQPDVPKEGFNEKSTSAPTKKDVTSNQVDDEKVKKVSSAVTEAMSKDTKEKKDEIQGTTNELKNDTIIKDEFQSATNELFKLGKMPSEHSEGPNLDAGSTLLKAMGSFKPEQINAMSADTKQLLETQKSLMGMLTQMRPVLADGKELLQTFSGMFGGGAFKL